MHLLVHLSLVFKDKFILKGLGSLSAKNRSIGTNPPCSNYHKLWLISLLGNRCSYTLIEMLFDKHFYKNI